jgi:hypothetical protein
MQADKYSRPGAPFRTTADLASPQFSRDRTLLAQRLVPAGFSKPLPMKERIENDPVEQR